MDDVDEQEISMIISGISKILGPWAPSSLMLAAKKTIKAH